MIEDLRIADSMRSQSFLFKQVQNLHLKALSALCLKLCRILSQD